MKSGWNLLWEERYKEALPLLEDEARRDDSNRSLANLGIGCLCTGDVARAKDIFERLISKQPGRNAGYYEKAGVCYWLMGDPSSAVAAWHDGIDCGYADAAGGMQIPLLLYFASVRTPEVISLEDAEAIVERRLKNRRSHHWPGPIGRFLLGEYDEVDLRAFALSEREHLDKRQNAQGDFYVGVAKYRDGNRRGYAPALKKCTAHHCVILDEFFLAQYELDRISSRRRKSATKSRARKKRKT